VSYVGDSALTTDNEINLFRTKLSSLRGVTDLALNIVLSHKLHSLQPACVEQQMSIERVHRQLEENQSLNCGGQFVWTDSILVKCLRDGHWLLIDNVNFCRYCLQNS
jgi:midasin (ATPase involved in ribosome maturation)